jgi:hypothetical protein
MSNDNYPAGVTDAHPHFNPFETYMEVECTTEEALVVPSFTVKAELTMIKTFAEEFASVAGDDANWDRFVALRMMIDQLQGKIDEIEREGDYECQWKGEQELPVSEEAEWDCPRCGVTQTTDTVPEGRDPDEGWDSRHDD